MAGFLWFRRMACGFSHASYNPDLFQFCPHCGDEIPQRKKCECGSLVPPHWNYCVTCGKART